MFNRRLGISTLFAALIASQERGLKGVHLPDLQPRPEGYVPPDFGRMRFGLNGKPPRGKRVRFQGVPRDELNRRCRPAEGPGSLRREAEIQQLLWAGDVDSLKKAYQLSTEHRHYVDAHGIKEQLTPHYILALINRTHGATTP